MRCKALKAMALYGDITKRATFTTVTSIDVCDSGECGPLRNVTVQPVGCQHIELHGDIVILLDYLCCLYGAVAHRVNLDDNTLAGITDTHAVDAVISCAHGVALGLNAADA